MQLNLSENIKKYRKEMDLTQEELAEAFGVTIGAVSKWESGSTVPDILTLVELADFFSISMDVLLGVTVSSKSAEDIRDRIKTLRQESRNEEALAEVDKAIVRYPANFMILYEGAVTYHVIAAMNNEKYGPKAIGLYEAALKYIDQNTDPDVDEFSIRLCIAELKSEQNPEEALEEFYKINFMGIADVHIATILMNTGKIDEALDRYTRILVSILVKSLQFSCNMAIALAKTGKKANVREACEVLDWCINIYDSVNIGKISYLEKMKVALMIIKSMCLAFLGKHEEMRRYIDEAYKLALEYDKIPTNNIHYKIKFWHGEKDYKPALYDGLGRGAVDTINTLFSQKADPLPQDVFEKMGEARRYWAKLKTDKK